MVVDSRAESLLPLLHHLAALDLARPTLRPAPRRPWWPTPRSPKQHRAHLRPARRGDGHARRPVTTSTARPSPCWVRGNVLLGLGDVAGAARAWKRAADLDPTTELVEDMSLANLAYASYCVSGDVDEALHLAARRSTSPREPRPRPGRGPRPRLRRLPPDHGRSLRARPSEPCQRPTRPSPRQQEAEPPYEWPLAHAGIGALAGLRGHAAEADTAFLRGVLLARQLENPWYEAIVRTFARRSHDARRHPPGPCRLPLGPARVRRRSVTLVGHHRPAGAGRRRRSMSGEIEAARLLAERLLDRARQPGRAGPLPDLAEPGALRRRRPGRRRRSGPTRRSRSARADRRRPSCCARPCCCWPSAMPLRAPDAIERARAPQHRRPRLRPALGGPAQPAGRTSSAAQSICVGDGAGRASAPPGPSTSCSCSPWPAAAASRPTRSADALWPDGDPAQGAEQPVDRDLRRPPGPRLARPGASTGRARSSGSTSTAPSSTSTTPCAGPGRIRPRDDRERGERRPPRRRDRRRRSRPSARRSCPRSTFEPWVPEPTAPTHLPRALTAGPGRHPVLRRAWRLPLRRLNVRVGRVSSERDGGLADAGWRSRRR